MRPNLKLVLMSGGQNPENKRLHQAAVDMVRSRRKCLTYFPFCGEGSSVFFNRTVRRYKSYGVQEFKQLITDETVSKSAISRALNTDIVYLAGGNTFYYLKHLRAQGLISALRDYAESGGVIVGLSAGALLLTPHIELASIPSHEADENDVGLKNLRALGLVRFEFSPHYSPRSGKSTRELLKYSRQTKNPVYACEDGGGLVIDRGEMRTLGSCFVFKRGVRTKLD